MSFIGKIRILIGRIIEYFLLYDRIIYIKRDSNIIYPSKGYIEDAGFDLYTSKTTIIKPKDFAVVPTGVYLEPKDKIWFEIKGRSSTLKKHGITVVDAVIDNGYRGEMFVQVYNPGHNRVVILKGIRIAQIIPHLLFNIKFKIKRKLNLSDRNKGGFGSTGE